ncbi:MAG: 1,2-dihydroxy-3-keto-5-methylthiopentene dioxygenase [Flavobacteriales bacterium]
MAILSAPNTGLELQDPIAIRNYLNNLGVHFEQWHCDVIFNDDASQEEILAAYAKDLDPFMKKGSYQTADVISIHAATPNYEAIRAKFLAEHIHTEDEIRFFVDGQGLFWFNLDGQEVFNVLCERGDLISVPAGTKHWFDAGEHNPFVKAIRIFTDMSGWTPHYTDAGTEQNFSDFKIPSRG